jgi:hypothetical protein
MEDVNTQVLVYRLRYEAPQTPQKSYNFTDEGDLGSREGGQGHTHRTFTKQPGLCAALAEFAAPP